MDEKAHMRWSLIFLILMRLAKKNRTDAYTDISKLKQIKRESSISKN